MSKVPGYHSVGSRGDVILTGIVKLQKDDHGRIGLEIPDLLSINNLTTDTEEIPETSGDLFLHTENSKVYSKQEEEGE